RTGPISITNSRFSNANQMANGMVQLAGQVYFVSNLFNFNPPNNGVFLGNNSGGEGAPVTSINNQYLSQTAAKIGFDNFTYPAITSINDYISTAFPQTNLTSNG